MKWNDRLKRTQISNDIVRMRCKTRAIYELRKRQTDVTASSFILHTRSQSFLQRVLCYTMLGSSMSLFLSLCVSVGRSVSVYVWNRAVESPDIVLQTTVDLVFFFFRLDFIVFSIVSFVPIFCIYTNVPVNCMSNMESPRS